MADNHDNDHDSDLEDRTSHKNPDTTPKDTPQLKNEKNSPNAGAMEALRDHLKQLEEEALHQRKAEKDQQREIKRRRELEDKLLKLEVDLKVPKDFKAPDMTPYDGTSDPSHHLSNFRSRMYLTEASDAFRYSPSRGTKPNTHRAY
ncbi:hypothetical protein AHAS_Ahas03G0211400 [Arachis hypogaea]